MNDQTAMNATAKCRGCGRVLVGAPYHLGGSAYDPNTMERSPVNQFGGFVCSRQCDVNVCLDMLSSMPGAGPAKQLDSFCRAQVTRNWPDQ